MRSRLLVGTIAVMVTAVVAPAVEAGVRPVPIRGVNQLTDLDIVVVVHARRPLTPRDRRDLTRLLFDWYNVGADGGYGGPDGGKGVFHFMSSVGYHRDGRTSRVAAYLDFGSAGAGAFLVLRRMLAVFNADQADRNRADRQLVKYVSVHNGPTNADCKVFPVICR